MSAGGASAGPLEGVRIIEVCHMLAGPYCGMLLADLGAEVIKVESGEGDLARSIGGHSIDDHSLYFASLNRNKKSVKLDLTDPKDLAAFHDLVARSQGLITNLRPRAIKKLGLTYESLGQYNPSIVCVAITGFGLDGPYSEFPAYDYIIQAMVGVMMLTGEPDGPPVRAGYSVVDNTGGMMGTVALLAKLVSGKGGQVDVALYDILLSQLNYLAAAYLNAGDPGARYPGGGHAFNVPAQIFESADGHVALFITHDEFWGIFAGALGRPDWLADDRFATMHARSRNRELVVSAIAGELRRKPTTYWIDTLRPLGIVIGGVSAMSEALDGDNVKARDMIATIETLAGPMRLVANPLKMSGYSPTYAPPPRLGEHTAECFPEMTGGRP